jgi:hypothetical protein
MLFSTAESGKYWMLFYTGLLPNGARSTSVARSAAGFSAPVTNSSTVSRNVAVMSVVFFGFENSIIYSIQVLDCNTSHFQCKMSLKGVCISNEK